MRSIPIFVLLVVPGAAVAEELPLEEVVVHSSLRGETVAQLPASTTILGSETLSLAGVQHFEDVLGLVPNLNWAAGSSRPRYFQLRGIGELEQFQGAPNASVGFLIDDIDFSGIGMPATLYDVEQIEVLRGPQGTTYGANALAGLISVHTRAPSLQPELRVEATAGDYGTHGEGAVMGGPIGSASTAAYRLVAQRYSSDGFRQNAFLRRDDTNGYDETTLRGKLHFAPADSLQLDLTTLFVDLDNGYDAFAVDNSRTTRSDKPGRDAQRSLGLATRAEYTGFDLFAVRSTTTYADSDIVYSFDGDWGSDPSYDFTSQFRRNRQTWSEDLRAVSAPSAKIAGRAAWVAGIYVLHSRETNDQLDVFNGDVDTALVSRYQATNLAAYGEINTDLTESTQLRAGVRFERRSANYADSNGLGFDPGETMSGGHISLDHLLKSGGNLYGTLSRGYKAGGFNIGANIPEPRRNFAAEFLWNLEAGYKGWLAQDRLRTQSAFFYMRRTQQQVNTSFQFDPDNPLEFVFYTDNAARGENYGLETALAWQATPRLELSGNLGLLETRYIGYRLAERDLDGREQASAPQYQIALAAQYRHPSGFIARLDTQSVDDFYFDASHDERAHAYTLVNLKLGYERPRWSLHAWARNLFGEEYAMRGFFFANEPPDFVPKRYVQAGDPRQIGVTFDYSFR
jgi:iron complex outermembrane recepter protein